MRIIFHIDFDSYFVSALRTIKPWLKGKEVGVGAKNSNSIMAALSYEAKSKGAKVGQPLFLIRQKCPKIIVENANFPLFIKISSGIFDYLMENYSKITEVASIDECYMDVTELINQSDIEDSSIFLAYKIQSEILKIFDIPITIGISYNKFLAKMTTNLAKPFGIMFTKKSQIKEKFYNLPIDNFFGIGKALTKKLKSLNINTIQDLSDVSTNNIMMRNIFNKNYVHIIECLNGTSSDIVDVDYNEYKNIGNSLTFPNYELTEFNDLIEILLKIVEKVVIRSKNRNLKGKLITLELKYEHGKFKTHQKQINNYTNDSVEINKIIHSLLTEFWNGDPVHGVGVRLGHLMPANEIYIQLKLDQDNNKETAKFDLIDKINDKFNKKLIIRASDYLKTKHINKNQSKFLQEDIEIYKNKSSK